ncbi:DUF885 domain-containing protein [Erysipelothrix sp. HDW6B]|uniref:DUF885 domain-containing protein n=1 Tax=Erysipelothrix sp. HDW6B TaxID=2714929 RepID=UPI001408C0B8|nr:DUF885 domain-containing protein [Erysipelothrix sp. HDW6B]QIK85704.1 DUF885 domain-containing protein [Erysipelothrix sp. HDW6B]
MKKILISALIALLVLTGCTTKPKNVDGTDTPNAEFTTYLDELLPEFIDPEDFSINLMFENPATYGIESKDYKMDFVSEEDYKEAAKTSKEVLDEVKGFDDATLSPQQQLDKKVIVQHLEDIVALQDYYDFSVGSSVLGYSRNLMGSFPAYLEIYEFRTEQDLKGYFTLLESLPETISKYIQLERDRQTRSTGFTQYELTEMARVSDVTAQQIAQPDYYLIAYMNEKIDGATFLDASQKETAKARSQALISKQLYESYQMMATELGAIQVTDTTLAGMSTRPNGKAFYEELLQQETGKRSTVKEILRFTEKSQQAAVETLYLSNEYTTEERDRYMELMMAESFGNYENGEALLEDIHASFGEDFPMIPMPFYELRKVHPSISESSAPAFYFSPPVDYTGEEAQVIYINGEFDNSLYTTYAHEGIPGHMYQFSYFKTLKDMHPIRSLISPSNSAEGWANYAEKLAVKYVHDEKFEEFYNAYMTLIETIHIRADIGVHYEGWTMEQFGTYMSDFFTLDEAGLESFYYQIIQTPAVYPTYYLSNLYIRDLKKTTKDALGSQYSEVEFHKVLLDSGAASMDIMEQQMQAYIKTKKK